MEHELQDLNVIRGSEDEEDMHDSTTLLEPSEEDAPARTDLNNNRGISGAYNESILSRPSFSSHYQAEDDWYVRASELIYLPTISSVDPSGSTGIVRSKSSSSDQL
jgi:hypothetical protein